MIDRLAKGKAPPNLSTPECECRFFVHYLLPCRHMFHQHMFGQKLLSDVTWHSFQNMFQESGFEVYEHRERVDRSEEYVTQANQGTECLRVRVEEVNERVRDKYFSIVESGNIKESEQFVDQLEMTMESLLKIN